MAKQKVLIDGKWREANAKEFFFAVNPTTMENLPDEYPISDWMDCEAALNAAAILPTPSPEKIAQFLNRFAERIEARSSEVIEMAHAETGLTKSPRLVSVELPRTTGQLRQAALAALDGSWALPTIDSKLNIRSMHAAIGPVCVLGPNNFPLAFNGVSGGDFAAAITAGNPVIAKAHPSHPGTTKLLAEEAFAAVIEANLPPATVQMVYHLGSKDGLRLVGDSRIGATAFTGSRFAGLSLKASADVAGKPIYLELSSLNPVVVLPGALEEREDKIADEYADSCLAASGQFCTKPGLLILPAGATCETFLAKLHNRFSDRATGPLLSPKVGASLGASLKGLLNAGAKPIIGGSALADNPFRYSNTLLRVDAGMFLFKSQELQRETFGNAALVIVAKDVDETAQILEKLDGQLTGCIYSHSLGSDNQAYDQLSPILRKRVGRLLNDKMPTGVAVSPAMNHGGPYPATGHPGFTAVGIPASLRRFSQLQCYDNVRPDRLPPMLGNHNPSGKTWRLVDGNWSQSDVTN